MATRTHPLYSNFTLGEISPRLYGSVTWEKYARGCKTLENMIIQQQGGVTGRPGTRFVSEVKTSAKATRLIPFRASDELAYVLEVGDAYVRIYHDGARLESGGLPVEVVSPFLEADLFQIHYGQMGSTLVAVHSDYPGQRFSRYTDTVWRMVDLDFNPPASLHYGTRTTAGIGGTLTPAAVSGTNVQLDASAAIFLASDVGREILVTSDGSRATIVTVDSTTRVHADIDDVFLSLTAIPAGSWHLGESPMTTITPSATGPIYATITLTLSADGWRPADVGKFVLLSGGLCQITTYTSALVVSAKVLIALDAVTAQPATAWSLEEPAWSAANGYPATVGYFEGRMLLGGPEDAVTMSASNDLLNFGLGSTDDAAISIKVASGELNSVRWFSPRRTLLMGTDSDEYSISGGSQGDAALTPTNIRVRPATPHGSSRLQPIRAEFATIFLTANGRTLRELAYSYEVDDYRAPDLLAVAEHLTNPYTIVDMAYQRPPESNLWCVRSDGTMLVCAYLRDQDIVGWARVVTDGLFESVCCIPSPDGKSEQVWVIVKRTIGGVAKRYIEWFDAETTLHSTTIRGLRTDSAVTYDGVATTTVTGLTHLEGETVQIVGDDAVYPDAVVTSGSVTLAGPAAEHIEVGLGFTRTLEPVRPEVPVSGSSMSLAKSWANISVRVKDTMGCTVNGEIIPWRAAGDPMDEPPPYFSGDKSLSHLGWDQDGYITITQTQPLPITVLAITGILAVGE